MSKLVDQGAKALTASNRRTVGRGCPEGRDSPLLDGVEGSAKAPSSWGAGEREVSPRVVQRRYDASGADRP